MGKGSQEPEQSDQADLHNRSWLSGGHQVKYITFLLRVLVLKKDTESRLWDSDRVFLLKAMSGKMCSSNSVVQAQKLVDQLQVEASMERIKVCKNLNNLFTTCILSCHISVLQMSEIL